MDNQLRARFGGELFEPDDPGYEEARRPWNATIEKRPALVARCSSTEGVVAALGLARREGLEVAIRAGGHSFSGNSATEGGMLIDLSPMDAVDVEPEERRARVQGGTLLGRMDRETQRHRLATTAGMVSHTGVAGLTLGGGYGHLARLHGLACDNLISVEIVTASGEVVTASEDENPDLFWGIRGGGGNFGIVTSFEFRLHPVGPNVLTVDLLFEAADGPAVLRAYRDFAAEAPPEVVSGASAMAARSTWTFLEERWIGQPVIDVAYTYVGNDFEEGARLAEPIRRAATPIYDEVEPMAYLDLQQYGDEPWRPGRRRYWKGSLLWELSDAMLEEFVAQGEALVGTGCGLEVVSLGGAISDVGEDETAYSNRDATFDFIALAQWDEADEDDRHVDLTRKTWEAIARFSPGGVYVNNLGADADARIREAYGAAKYERLVALKDRWDPDNVFHLNANIRPSAA